MTAGNVGQQGGAAGSGLPAELQTANATAEDRSMAMIAHLLGIVGFLGPLIIFLIKKDGASKFLTFHMKQSLFFQIGVGLVLFVLSILIGVITVVTLGFGAICFSLVALGGLGGAIYAIMGGITVNGGKDFEYYLVGPWVRKSL